MKRFVALLLAGMCVFSLVSCSAGTTVSKDYVMPKIDPNELVPSSEPLKPVEGAKITILIGDVGRTKWSKDTYLVQEWSKRMGNADIEIIPVSKTEVTQKLATMIASKSLPDMFMLADDPVTFAKQYGAKLLYPINKKLSQMPNTLKLIKKYPQYTKLTRVDDGNIYLMPFVADYKYFSLCPMVSPKIEAELGIKPQDITDMNQLLDILRQWKKKYPDSYPFLTRHGDKCGNLIYVYKTGIGFYLNGDTDTIKYGPADDSYRELVRFLATCYKEGLLHPDYATMNEAVWRELFAAEKGIFTVDNFSQAQQIAKDPFDPSQAFIPIISPKVNGVQGYTSIDRGSVAPNEGGWMFKADSPYIDNMMAFADWAMSDEGATFFEKGRQGETWEYLKDEPGQFVVRTPSKYPDKSHIWAEYPEITKEMMGVGQQTYRFRSLPENLIFGQYMQWSRFPDFNKENAKKITDMELKTYNMIANTENAIAPAMPTMPMTADENLRVKQIKNQIDTIVLEYVAKMIKGQLSVETDWDAFISKLNEFKYKEALEIYNRAYVRYKSY